VQIHKNQNWRVKELKINNISFGVLKKFLQYKYEDYYVFSLGKGM